MKNHNTELTDLPGAELVDAARRKALLYFDEVTVPELREALHIIERTEFVEGKRGSAVWQVHQAVAALLDTIESSDADTLERLWPMKRAITFATAGPDEYGDAVAWQAHLQSNVVAAQEFERTVAHLPRDEQLRRANAWVMEQAFGDS